MVLFLLLFALIACSVIGAILYLIYLPFKINLKRKERLTRATSRKINIAFLAVIFITACSITYYAAYPPESFYKDEFKSVTGTQMPLSADFISKAASYPDQHGKYYSTALIKLSKSDFNKLFKDVSNNSEMDTDNLNAVLTEQLYPEHFKLLQSFNRKTTPEDERERNIRFYDDRQTISIYLSRM